MKSKIYKIFVQPNGKEKVRIANSEGSRARYTSPQRAQVLLDTGIAGLTDDGDLFVYHDEQKKKDSVDYLIRVNRGNVIFWNGPMDPKGRFAPGIVRC